MDNHLISIKMVIMLIMLIMVIMDNIIIIIN